MIQRITQMHVEHEYLGDGVEGRIILGDRIPAPDSRNSMGSGPSYPFNPYTGSYAFADVRFAPFEGRLSSYTTGLKITNFGFESRTLIATHGQSLIQILTKEAKSRWNSRVLVVDEDEIVLTQKSFLMDKGFSFYSSIGVLYLM